MCENCVEIDTLLVRYREMSRGATDRSPVGVTIADWIQILEARKRDLHPANQIEVLSVRSSKAQTAE